MIEAVGGYTGKKIGPTYFRGQLPIDGIWTIADVTVANTCIMPVGYGIGDHRLFIVDLHTSSLVGPGPPREQQAASRRLNTCLPHAVKKYTENLEENLRWHRLIKKLGEAHSEGRSKEHIQSRIVKVDRESMQFMKHAAKKCRTPFQISMTELKTRLEVCEERNNYFRKNGARYQKKHLLKRVEVAREDGRDEAANKILAIIKREQDRSFWRRINYTFGKVKGKSPNSMQVPRNGQEEHIDEYSTQATIYEAIWANIRYKGLYLAEEAPICQGQQRSDLGYNAATCMAAAILKGRYIYPEVLNQATSHKRAV